MGKDERKTSSAGWRTLDWPWWDTHVINCQMCGQMIPRDVWVAEDGMEFCSEACDGLYRTYWLPRYGSGAK